MPTMLSNQWPPVSNLLTGQFAEDTVIISDFQPKQNRMFERHSFIAIALIGELVMGDYGFKNPKWCVRLFSSE